LIQGFVSPPFLAEHRHATNDQRQFSVGSFEIKPHFSIIDDGYAFDFIEISAKLRCSLLAGQSIKRIFDISGQHRVAIVKPRQGVDLERHREFVCGHSHILGNQTISGSWLIEITHQQGLNHQTAEGWRRRSFEGEGVVFVKTGCSGRGHHIDMTAFGRNRVDIGEMFKTWWIFNVAKLSVGMARLHR